jgi:hypothetical protein
MIVSQANTIACTAARKFFGDVWKETNIEFEIEEEIDTTMDVDDDQETNNKEKDKKQ